MWLLWHLYGGVNASKIAIMEFFPENHHHQAIKYSSEGNIILEEMQQNLKTTPSPPPQLLSVYLFTGVFGTWSPALSMAQIRIHATNVKQGQLSGVSWLPPVRWGIMMHSHHAQAQSRVYIWKRCQTPQRKLCSPPVRCLAWHLSSTCLSWKKEMTCLWWSAHLGIQICFIPD